MGVIRQICRTTIQILLCADNWRLVSRVYFQESGGMEDHRPFKIFQDLKA